MVIGNGLLARAFATRFGHDEDVAIFASGVSNSTEDRDGEFARERVLLLDALAAPARRLVYFGSCGVAARADGLTPYMAHKLAMEALVLASASGLVLRLPQVVGVTPNPHTLTNYLRDRIVSGEAFCVWARAERNLVDIDDIAAIGAELIARADGSPEVLSIAAAASTPMPDIVAIFERVLQRRARFTTVDRGHPLPIDSRHAVAVARTLGIDLGAGYTERVIRKYYGQHPVD